MIGYTTICVLAVAAMLTHARRTEKQARRDLHWLPMGTINEMALIAVICVACVAGTWVVALRGAEWMGYEVNDSTQQEVGK